MIAALTLPSVVLTHLNGDHWAARLPLPVTIAVCSSPASAAAVQQRSPSVTSQLVEARCLATSFLTSLALKQTLSPWLYKFRSETSCRLVVAQAAQLPPSLPDRQLQS